MAPSRTHGGVSEVPSDFRGVTTGRRMTNNGVSDKEVEGTQPAALAVQKVSRGPRGLGGRRVTTWTGWAPRLARLAGLDVPFLVLAVRLKPGAGSLVSPCSVCR